LIGEGIIDFFGSMGEMGMLASLALIILIDATLFPTLPEGWMVFIFGALAVGSDAPLWGVMLVLVATVAGMCGNLVLYGLVKRARLPQRIERVMKKYTDFLVVSDERLLLINRIAPVVPYTGAFMAVCKWDLRKCLAYIFVGGVARWSVIVVLVWLSFDNIRQDLAPWVALIAVIAVVVASLVASLIYRRRLGLRGEASRSQ
jgi:membrane protein DedA with SNARE-associated domain